VVNGIALISSPHPAALRTAVGRPDQGRALLPSLLSYQVPLWPEHALTRHDAQALEDLVRSRISEKWAAGEDFSEAMAYMRQAIQIPSAAHSALEYQRWAVRSQLRGEGRRFMKLMNRPLDIPLLHLRGHADPYVLADAAERSRSFAPRGRFVEIPGVGHYAHEEAPESVNEELQRFLDSQLALLSR
jgi:pimeloyl-ACP methyl ester carboxylesterase